MGVTARNVCNTLLLLNAGVLIESITSHRKREFLWTLEPVRKEKVETLVAAVMLIRSGSLEVRLDRGGRGCQSSCCRPVQHLFGPQHLLIAHTDEEHLMTFLFRPFFFFLKKETSKKKIFICVVMHNRPKFHRQLDPSRAPAAVGLVHTGSFISFPIKQLSPAAVLLDAFQDIDNLLALQAKKNCMEN